GTSTYDGMALAQAIVEYIHNNLRAKTLFSTHYHELTDLATSLDRLKNIHVRAEEYEGNVVFLHQIQEGAADQSYGIQVAKLADLPDTLITRASTILEQLENNERQNTTEKTANLEQLSFFAEDKIKEKTTKSKSTKSESPILQELTDLD